jgi:hypothetical protein
VPFFRQLQAMELWVAVSRISVELESLASTITSSITALHATMDARRILILSNGTYL